MEMSENESDESESKILPHKALCIEVAHCLSGLVISYLLLLYHKCFVQPFSFTCLAYLLYQ